MKKIGRLSELSQSHTLNKNAGSALSGARPFDHYFLPVPAKPDEQQATSETEQGNRQGRIKPEFDGEEPDKSIGIREQPRTWHEEKAVEKFKPGLPGKQRHQRNRKDYPCAEKSS